MLRCEDVVDVARSVTFLRCVGVNGPFVIDDKLNRADGQSTNHTSEGLKIKYM